MKYAIFSQIEDFSDKSHLKVLFNNVIYYILCSSSSKDEVIEVT